MRTILITAIFASAALGTANAQEACKSESDAQDKASKAFDTKLSEFNEKNPDEAPPQACSGGKIRWEPTTTKLPYPEFSSKKSSVKFSIPEMKMQQHSYTVKEPITRCENKVIGKKPEVTCSMGPWGPRCTTHFTDLITRVCWPETRDKDIVISTPEAKMVVKEFSTNVPTVTMKTKDVVFHTPQWYADSGCLGQDCSRMCEDETKEQVAATEAKRNSFLAPTKVALLKSTADVFSCNGNEIGKQRDAALAEYDKYIKVAEVTLQEMRAQGLTEPASKQEEQLISLKRERQALVDQMDKALKELDSQSEKALNEMGADRL